MSGLTYTTYVSALSTLLVIENTNPDFQIILPDAIDYAEQRILRELDLLSTVVRDATANLTPGDRNFTLPSVQGIFVVVNGINAITPAGSTPGVGTRNPLTPTSLNYLDMVWPDSTVSGLPSAFAMVTQTSIVVGPWPSDSYTLEVIGTQRPSAISADNPVTFISQNLPDLFLAASMVFMSAFQRNFGAQADDPQQAQSWENQTKLLMASADAEEARKKFMGSAWSSLPQGPAASPPRN